jgi:hypothetical protein
MRLMKALAPKGSALHERERPGILIPMLAVPVIFWCELESL